MLVSIFILKFFLMQSGGPAKHSGGKEANDTQLP